MSITMYFNFHVILEKPTMWCRRYRLLPLSHHGCSRRWNNSTRRWHWSWYHRWRM